MWYFDLDSNTETNVKILFESQFTQLKVQLLIHTVQHGIGARRAWAILLILLDAAMEWQ